jgi:hypothetical protein
MGVSSSGRYLWFRDFKKSEVLKTKSILKAKQTFMKKVSLIKAITLFLGVLLLTASLFQCKKEGDIIKNLDRSYVAGPDSTVYASFYDEFKISPSASTADVNDVIKFRGVQTIIHEYCGTSNCHGGPISPKFDSYNNIMRYVVAGNPSGSKLWEYITTNNFNKAMPPVNSNHEMNAKDKGIILNWIVNGAKEIPTLADFRPAAIQLIQNGCGSANCHNQGTITGSWARKGLLGTLTSTDTVPFTNPLSGTAYNQLVNVAKRTEVWGVYESTNSAPYSYKDSVKLFYADTLANASFRPFKSFRSPWTDANRRGPLNTYDDVLMDILYPKNVRDLSGSNTSPYIYVNGVKCYAKGNYLNSTDAFIRKIDSTMIYRNVFTLAEYGKDGSMAWDDGGLKPAEIALIKAWYFADPNIPDVWKYGKDNSGIFRNRNSATWFTK